MSTITHNTMQTINDLIERLRNASTAEIPSIQAEYEAYLATLGPNEQVPVIKQVNSVLRELAGQSVNRLEEATAAYLTSKKGHIAA